MTSADEDDIWRSIVKNYGERALPDPERRGQRQHNTAEAEGQSPSEELAPSEDRPFPDDAPADAAEENADSAAAVLPDAESERFIPPLAPAAAPIAPARRAAWAGVIGAPLVFVLLALAGRPASGPLAVLLLSSLVGGFGYLVWTMSSEPRDPFDDGSRV